MMIEKLEGGTRMKGDVKKTLPKKPLISIITIVYNGDKYLECTINSVINQKYDNIEYIIIDGGSKDNSIKIMQKYNDKISYWISEPDNGIYDAWNKGLAQSNGDIIGILNADDWYNDNIFEDIVNKFLEVNEYFIYFGNMQMITDIDKKLFIKQSNFNDLKARMSVNYPTVFLSKDIYKERIFNDTFKITGDYEFFLYLYKLSKVNNLNIINVNKVITNMRIEGVSDKLISLIKVISEDYKARKIHLSMYNSILYLIRDILFKLPKKIIKYIIGYSKFNYLLEERIKNKFK
jgi:glycosyltransferase involved in cell wall biosynthesis